MDLSGRECIQMAVHAVERYGRSRGTVTDTISFWCQPALRYKISGPKQLQRAKELESAMKDVAREPSRRLSAYGMRNKRGGKGKERVTELRKLSIGSEVPVYRQKYKS